MDHADGRVSPNGWENRTHPNWAATTELFGQAIELSPEERADFLARLSADDPVLAAEVASLIEHHERPGECLLDSQAAAMLGADVSGRQLGAYRLIRLLGCGGMGAVYLAERSDGSFSKHVAIKLLSPALTEARERFYRERELLARLEHPNIARVLDAGTSDGWPYLVMEYVDGVRIDDYCEQQQLSIDDRIALLLQVCGAITHAHQRLVIHCDIKPENILVTSDGTVKVLDFGIAKLLDLGTQQTRLRPATPLFSSPEQLQGDPLTTATDVYGIGLLGYVLLAGGSPNTRPSRHIADAVHAVLNDDPIAASEMSSVPPAWKRRLRGDLDNVLAKAVARQPNRRYSSPQQLADDLDAFRRGFPVRARPDFVLYRTRRFVRRHRAACAAGALSIAALAGAALFSARQAQIAARRFDDLRAFARSIVFEVDDMLRPISGTTAARKHVVDTALVYLDRLSHDEGTDLALREELAAAYIRVGKVQGGAFLPNLGDTAGAIGSFAKAIAAAGASPMSDALERLRIEAHINIALLARDPVDGGPELERAITAAERQLAANPHEIDTLRLMAQALHGKATIAHVTNHLPDHEHAASRAIALREQIVALDTATWQDEADLARSYAQHALALAQKEETHAALARVMHGRRVLERALERSPANQVLIRGLAENRSRAGALFIALTREDDAEQELTRAVDLLQPLVASDANNRQYKADLAYAWLQIGDLRRLQGLTSEALRWHQQALAVRRERARTDRTFMFVPWELTRSLNTVGELLLDGSPAGVRQAHAAFEEARQVAEATLGVAPSFNEIRKQLALSYEGLARTALQQSRGKATAIALLQQTLATWRDVAARTVGDRRHEPRAAGAQRLFDLTRALRD